MKFADSSLSYHLPLNSNHANKPRTIRMTDSIGVLFGNRLIQQKPPAPCRWFLFFHILDGIQLNKTDNLNFCFLITEIQFSEKWASIHAVKIENVYPVSDG